VFSWHTVRVAGLAILVAGFVLTGCGASHIAKTDASHVGSATQRQPLAECSEPVFENPTTYVNFIAKSDAVSLTQDQVATIAQRYSCPLSKSSAKEIRIQMAGMYIYPPAIDTGGVAIEVQETLQDTYGKRGISLSDSEVTTLVQQYLSGCSSYTTDGYNPDSLQCLAAIQPEINSAAGVASS
jgi:hypothetical protein